MQNLGNRFKKLSLPSMMEQMKEHSGTKKNVTCSRPPIPFSLFCTFVSSGSGVVWMYTMISGKVIG